MTALVLAGCSSSATPDDASETPDATVAANQGPLVVDEVATDLVVPREIVPVGAGRSLVSDQAGTVVVLTDGTVRDEPFLDVTGQILGPTSQEQERGLAGFAVAPDFTTSGTVYTVTTEAVAPIDAADGYVAHVFVLTRWHADPEALLVDPASAEVLLRVPRPTPNHVGGEIVFDDAGLLYTSIGAAENDPSEQDPNTFDGSVLRIDPREGSPYGIPADNPFADGGGLAEVYSYGYRNPWRLSWTPQHGLLVAEAMFRTKPQQLGRPEPGDNAGYPEVTAACWDDAATLDAGCDSTASGTRIAPPVLEYPAEVGEIMSGGVVVPEDVTGALAGTVLVSDWRGALLAATPGHAPWEWETLELPEDVSGPSSLLWDIATDGTDVYLMTTSLGLSRGSVHRLVLD